MASTLSFFMTPEDELAFARALEPLQLEVYPEVSEKGYRPFLIGAGTVASLTEDAYYLAAPAAGELVAREVRRGPHKGMLEIDEVRSPVMHYERSRMEEGELRSGRLWAELEILGDRQHLLSKPDLLRQVFERLRSHFKKHFHHSRPVGFFVGPHAARRAHGGLVLREAGRKGGVIAPYK